MHSDLMISIHRCRYNSSLHSFVFPLNMNGMDLVLVFVEIPVTVKDETLFLLLVNIKV